jgi:putative membrane protein insertion efficiency factor
VLVHAYRVVVRPWLEGHCRFSPSCSAFALEALERYGARRGAALAVRRVARCHPWSPGGWDPVPVEER